jgi:hypothetical protein
LTSKEDRLSYSSRWWASHPAISSAIGSHSSSSVSNFKRHKKKGENLSPLLYYSAPWHTHTHMKDNSNFQLDGRSRIVSPKLSMLV